MKNKTEDIDRKIAMLLEKLAQINRILLWDIAKHENLSPLQIQFIQFLASHPGELPGVSALAREFDLTRATVSVAVRSLEEKGNLLKKRNSPDGRSYALELTGKGRKLARKIIHWPDMLIAHIGGLPREDKESCLTVLVGLIRSLFEGGVIQVARICPACANFQGNMFSYPDAPHYCNLTGRAFPDSEFNVGCEFYDSAVTQ